MNWLVAFWIFAVISVECLSTKCKLAKNCTTCINSSNIDSTCEWCPLDRKCYVNGTSGIACTSKMVVKHPSVCLSTTIATYVSELAVMLTIVSGAAYVRQPQPCLDKYLASEQIQVVDIIGRACSSLFDDECVVLVAISHVTKRIYLSYRGSTSVKQLLTEIVTTLITAKVPFKGAGYVQKYFRDTFMLLYPCVKNSLEEKMKAYPGYTVAVTGHSLGGALASLAALALVQDKLVPSHRVFLYNFGSPRVGDKLYANNHDRLVPNSFRVVHYKDIVAHIPTRSPSLDPPHHHKTEIFYPMNMTPSSNYTVCIDDEDISCTDRWASMTLYRKCLANFSACRRIHVTYFGIIVPDICNDKKPTRAANGSKLWGKFSNNTCTRIPVGIL